MIYKNKSYSNLVREIENEWNSGNYDVDTLNKISKKYTIDKSVIREFIGLKDYYDFYLDN